MRAHLGAGTIDLSEPGSIILVANEGRMGAAAWGGLLTRAARRRGVAGLIIDGAARDIDDIEAAGMPLFARGATAVSARGRFVEVETARPVTVGGVVVAPDDWAVADGSGVVFIPRRHLARVASAVDELLSVERAMARRLDAGEPVATVLGSRYQSLLVGSE